jgi:phenylpropionate dioxygenase-like ring-hydroxylating dioxygenase large terminal subunit
MKLVEGGWPTDATLEATLPGEYYASPAIFQRDLERIWFNTWLCAGRLEQIPEKGDFFTREVGNESVIVVRNRDGGVTAFYNVCRHRGSRLCNADAGHLKGALIRCPYHAWTYEATHGTLVATPNLPDNAELFDRSRFPLVRLRVETWEGFIWINFNPDAPSLAEALGLPSTYAYYERYHVGDLKIGKQIPYNVNANWKVVMENGLECYHCLHIHPELSKCTPPTFPRHWLHEELPESKVFKHAGGMETARGFSAVNLDGKPRRPRFRDLAERDARTIYYAFIFPDMFFGFASDYVFVFTIWPMAVNKSRVLAWWLFEPAVLAGKDFDPSDTVEFWDITNREDWRACEEAQLGSQSRAFRNGGVLIQNEWRVNKFRQWVLDELAD